MREINLITEYYRSLWILKVISIVKIMYSYHLEILRIVWSPKICVFERKENLKDLYDQKYDMYERVVTYEGEEFHSRICIIY